MLITWSDLRRDFDMLEFLKKNYLIIVLVVLSVQTETKGQIVLIGDNDPGANVYDGDFSLVWDYWRNASQSPFWTTQIVKGDHPMGLHYGSLFSSNEEGLAESRILDSDPNYQTPHKGDNIDWSFGADLEYISNGTLSVSLVFGEHERLLADKVKLIGSDKAIEHFKGSYRITEEDEKSGLPFIRVRFYSEQDVKVYLYYVNMVVVKAGDEKIQLQVSSDNNGYSLSWDSSKKDSLHNNYSIYRKKQDEDAYQLLGKTVNNDYQDSGIVYGVGHSYIVTRQKDDLLMRSNKVSVQQLDSIAPSPPTGLRTEIFDTEIKILWDSIEEADFLSYSIYRGDSTSKNFKKIAENVKSNWFEDVEVPKNVKSSYLVYAHDYSGNRSKPSEPVQGEVRSVLGASFSDLILPMPIHKSLQYDLWGNDNVIPRDPDNGIEDPSWTYWGGRPVKDKDNDYHMLVTRWPEGALKGHWEWPNSTVAHVVSKRPTGPYLVKSDLAYDYKNGLGHNPDIILLNDGSYALYSLIEWEPTIFTSSSMHGPWTLKGVMKVDMDSADPDDKRLYQYTRNLSGVQLEDGRFLMVSKFGCMMISEDGLLGPYKVLTKTINENKSIPERYRQSNYEDPVMWRDEVQFHLIINAFLNYRAIYLRSADGIHWKYDPGLAYTPNSTSYVDGTQPKWYKLERPHVLQDSFGRATHLSVAVIDVPKSEDYGNDSHNAKNIIMPLQVPKRIKMLNKDRVSSTSKKIKIKVLAEDGFYPQTDINIKSLKFGASEEVNFGGGCSVIKTQNAGKDLIIVFDGKGNGIDENNFVGKLLGETNSGDLLIGYCGLQKDQD